MSNLQRALTQAQKPGIYQFRSKASPDFLRAEADRQGWRLFVLDGSKISTKKTFLEKIARAIKFPSYFGMNWDALGDCLIDMEWSPGAGYILVFQSPERFISTSPDDWQVALDIFKTTTDFWQQHNIPFYVLLQGGAVPETVPSL